MPVKAPVAAVISSLAPGFYVAAVLAATVSSAPAAAGERHVVELFTSQGCSSCPPADAVLGKLAQRTGVLALGYHVDYWDSLGWKDTLGSQAHTIRQRSYAASRGDGQVYTPQAVVDGKGLTIGSNGRSIDAMMDAPLPVDVKVTGKTVAVGEGTGSGSIWRVDITKHATVPIGRGENSGSTVTYVNAVRGMTLLGAWTGHAASYPLGGCGATRGADDCAVILQAGSGRKPGPILGAAIR